MSLPEPGERLSLSVRLDRPDGHSFAASVRGRAVPATRRDLLHAAVRHPWSTAAVSARIRWQGVRLYRRELPVIPGPRTCPRRGSSDQYQHLPARDDRLGPVARRGGGGRLARPRGRGPCLVRHGGHPAAGAGPPARRDISRRRGTGRPGHGPAPARGVLPQARRLRPDRVRRVLHGGGLGQPRPDRAAHRVRRARRRARPALAAAAAQAGRPPPAAGRPADGRGGAAQRRPPLRPVQRPVRAVPRRHHDLFLGYLPHRPGRHPRRRGPRRGAAPQDRPAARPGRGGAGLPGA